MPRSINRVQLLGNVGAEPEIKTANGGVKFCTFSLATTETWKDKQTGERKDRTEWHRVVIWNQSLIKVCENYLTKGSRVQILDGQLVTRSWDKDGQKRYSTEIVLRPYAGELILHDRKAEAGGFDSAPALSDDPGPNAADYFQHAAALPVDELEDEIPF